MSIILSFPLDVIGLFIKISHPFTPSSSLTDSNAPDLLSSDGERRVMTVQQHVQPTQHASTTIEGPRDIVGFIQYLISIDYLKESNITSTETPYARLFKSTTGGRKHSPYEVADGEEESDEEKPAKPNKSALAMHKEGKRISDQSPHVRDKEQHHEEVCDLDLSDWIRISGGNQTDRSPTPTLTLNNNTHVPSAGSGHGDISSSSSASDRKLDDSWMVL